MDERQHRWPFSSRFWPWEGFSHVLASRLLRLCWARHPASECLEPLCSGRAQRESRLGTRPDLGWMGRRDGVPVRNDDRRRHPCFILPHQAPTKTTRRIFGRSGVFDGVLHCNGSGPFRWARSASRCTFVSRRCVLHSFVHHEKIRPAVSGPQAFFQITMKIAYVTPHAPGDRRAYSGTTSHILKAFERAGAEVTPVGPLRDRGSWALKPYKLLRTAEGTRVRTLQKSVVAARL